LEVGARVSGDQLWACFLISQLAIAVSFWAIWQLARSIVSPLGALIAVLLLEGTATFTRYSPEFNANIVELPFWALAGWSFHRALRLHRSGDWALLGVWLALAGYGKYVAALLAATMVGFLLLDPLARRSWRTAGPYLCAAICITLLLPHL